MFSWNRRFILVGFWRGGIGGNYKLHLTILHLSRGDLQCDHDELQAGQAAGLGEHNPQPMPPRTPHL